MNILILNGPSLNLLGTREPEIYGSLTLDEINARLETYAQSRQAVLRFVQSNHEGVLIDALHDARGWASGAVINPGGLMLNSLSLRDAISSVKITAVEVHLSNVAARESFRHNSLIAPVCAGQITGLGWLGYRLALDWLLSSQENV